MYKEYHCPLILFTTQNDRLLGHFRMHCTQYAMPTPSLYLQVERDQPSHMHMHTHTRNYVVRIVHNTKALQTPSAIQGANYTTCTQMNCWHGKSAFLMDAIVVAGLTILTRVWESKQEKCIL